MRGATIELHQLLGANAPEDDRPKLDPEAAVMRLREWAERYAEAGKFGPRFGVGDLVTPFADSPFAGAGDPAVVIETRAVCPMDGLARICTCSQADTRILSIDSDGDVLPSWVESAQLELWNAK